MLPTNKRTDLLDHTRNSPPPGGGNIENVKYNVYKFKLFGYHYLKSSQTLHSINSGSAEKNSTTSGHQESTGSYPPGGIFNLASPRYTQITTTAHWMDRPKCPMASPLSGGTNYHYSQLFYILRTSMQYKIYNIIVCVTVRGTTANRLSLSTSMSVSFATTYRELAKPAIQ